MTCDVGRATCDDHPRNCRFDIFGLVYYYSRTMFAVIATGGKQYLAQVGDVLTIEKIEGKKGDVVTFDKVLMISEEDGSGINIGTPHLSITVTGEIQTQGRATKVEVVKYKNKTRYRKRVGHRQPYTKVKITKIGA